MISALEKTVKRNLLKYAAGHQIFCPSCGEILDYRRIVAWESPSGKHGVSCADCWRKGLAKIHDDKPHAYLLSIGWKADTLVDFDKPAKPKRQPKFNTMHSVISKDGQRRSFPASVAFSMYGAEFLIHHRMGRDYLPDPDAGYTVSERSTGAAVEYGKTKADTIRRAKAKLDSVGADGFARAMALVGAAP